MGSVARSSRSTSRRDLLPCWSTMRIWAHQGVGLVGGTNGKYVWRRWQGVCGRRDRYDRWVLVIAVIVTVGRRGGVRCRYMRLLGSARHVAFGSVSAVPEGGHLRYF